MSEDIRLLAQIRALSTLDQKFTLFADYMQAEHHYDAITYAIALNISSTEQLLKTTIMKERGLPPEWMRQYVNEQLVRKDISVQFVAYKPGPVLQSTLFNACDQGELAPEYREIPTRVRDYMKSGAVVPVQHYNLKGGFGLHSRSMTTDQHDARYANNGWLIETMCQLFHDACRWTDDIIAHTGLSDLNLLVLRLKAQGKGVKEILSVIERKNDKTVENHMRRVRKKLGVAKDSEAIAKASALGLLHGPDELPRDQLGDSFEDFLE
jgi:DNA-binding CsgD family transcriptional regulator